MSSGLVAGQGTTEKWGGRLDFKIPRSRRSVVAHVSRPTHPLYTGYIPWSAIHGPNYIFHHRIFCRAFSKMDSSKMFAFSCALSPCVCSVHATQSKGLRAKGLRAKRCLPLRRSGNITCDRSLVFISSFHQNVENVYLDFSEPEVKLSQLLLSLFSQFKWCVHSGICARAGHAVVFHMRICSCNLCGLICVYPHETA